MKLATNITVNKLINLTCLSHDLIVSFDWSGCVDVVAFADEVKQHQQTVHSVSALIIVQYAGVLSLGTVISWMRHFEAFASAALATLHL